MLRRRRVDFGEVEGWCWEGGGLVLGRWRVGVGEVEA